jgi:apolipoprotein N-acyltransferase
MLVNIACYLLVRRSEFRVQSLKIYILPIFCLIISLTYGYYKLLRTKNYELSTKISVIQANIPQDLKWDIKAKDFIFNEYFSLSAAAARENPDLIIWPEAASPAIIGEEPQYFEKIKLFARNVKIPLLFGAVTFEGGVYYNSALLISQQGELLARYNKLHLVPFGEYVPLKSIFGFLQTVVPIGEVAFGKDYTIFKLPPSGSRPLANFAVLICFEDLFPELSRKFRRQGVDFLVNITNDAWYKKTTAPFQHLQASVFRAVENRVNLIRAANTGVSCFILPSGRIVSLLSDSRGSNIFVRGYNTADVFISPQGIPFYSRWGDFFILACLIFIFYVIIARFKK